jgi:hypothetical protein
MNQTIKYLFSTSMVFANNSHINKFDSYVNKWDIANKQPSQRNLTGVEKKIGSNDRY